MAGAQSKETFVSEKSDLAYRPCVGVMLLNPEGLVWIGRRADKPNDEGAANGGRCRKAASTRARTPPRPPCASYLRKPRSRSAEVIAEAPEWYKYDLPAHLIGKSWGGKYRGQTQKWFALRFTGRDRESISSRPATSRNSTNGAGQIWTRSSASLCPSSVQVYERVIAAFRHLGA